MIMVVVISQERIRETVINGRDEKKAREMRCTDKGSAGSLWKERDNLISMFIQC